MSKRRANIESYIFIRKGRKRKKNARVSWVIWYTYSYRNTMQNQFSKQRKIHKRLLLQIKNKSSSKFLQTDYYDGWWKRTRPKNTRRTNKREALVNKKTTLQLAPKLLQLIIPSTFFCIWVSQSDHIVLDLVDG